MPIKIIYSCILALLAAQPGCVGANQNMEKDIILKILHYKVPCVGESAQLCFRIQKDGGETEFFYDEIEGFDYRWGYDYTISVEKKMNIHPKADASSFTYKLKKIIKKQRVAAGETFELALQADEQAFVEIRNGACYYFGKIKIETGTHSCEELARSKSGVFRHGRDEQVLVLAKIK